MNEENTVTEKQKKTTRKIEIKRDQWVADKESSTGTKRLTKGTVIEVDVDTALDMIEAGHAVQVK